MSAPVPVGPQMPDFPPPPETELEKLHTERARLQDLLAEAVADVHRARRERDEMRERVSEPYGCAHCGIAKRSHGRRWTTGVGYHAWTAPSEGQIAERMKARRTVRLGARAGELGRLRARVAELEAERRKYVGVEPTIAEEMAYLSRCIHAVDALRLPETLKVDSIDPQYRNGYVHALADMRTALESPVRESYPPALPWAALMDDEDLSDFLDELADAAGKPDTYQGALAEVEATCGRWRLTAEAQHGHNMAPGPDAMTRTFLPVASLREDVPDGEHYPAVHHSYRVGHDLPEAGGAGC